MANSECECSHALCDANNATLPALMIAVTARMISFLAVSSFRANEFALDCKRVIEELNVRDDLSK